MKDRTELNGVGVVVAVCVSTGGVPKHPVPRVELTLDGVVGDYHNHEKHRRPDRAISVQDIELLDELTVEGYPVGPGVLGENITVRGANVQGLAPGDRLCFDGGAVLEAASVRKPCYVLDGIRPGLQKAAVRRCGVLCRVIQTATVAPGQRVVVESRKIIPDERVGGGARQSQ